MFRFASWCQSLLFGRPLRTGGKKASKRRTTFQPRVEPLEDRKLLAVFAVQNTNDSDAGSLRQAIVDANNNPGPDEIHFNIPGAGVQTIAPLSPLPTIVDPVTIDGYTQPGASRNDDPNGFDGTLLVELNGINAGSDADGLRIRTGESTIRGLVINRFERHGIFFGQNVTAAGNVIEGNFIGTNSTGDVAMPNGGAGINLTATTLITENLFGGTTPAARNVISGNRYGAIWIGANGNTVQGNFIGTNAAGNFALGDYTGSSVYVTSDQNLIGGTVPGARNVISGNLYPYGIGGGVGISLGGSHNLVQGNFIGTDVSGTAPLGNTVGVVVYSESNNNTIGGGTPEARNVISANLLDGVEVFSENNIVQGNFIGTDYTGTAPLGNGRSGVVGGSIDAGTAHVTENVIAFNSRYGVYIPYGSGLGINRNVIYANGRLGIDLNGEFSPDPDFDTGVTLNDLGDGDGGANDGQNFPVITSGLTDGDVLVIHGSLNSTANTDFRLEFFGNAMRHPSGHGEGELFLGSTDVRTDASGNVSYSIDLGPIAVGHFVTATATNITLNNTSEFSAAVQVLAASAVVAYDDRFTIDEDTPLAIAASGVLANDFSASGNVLTTTLVSGPQHGTLTLSPDGSFSYRPDDDYSGRDGFGYTASDGTSTSDVATVTIDVSAVNDAPMAAADRFTLGGIMPAVVVSVLDNDTDADHDPLTAALVSGPDHGVLVLSLDGSLSYVPNRGFHGSDSFTYQASDGSAESNLATVTINVTSLNDAPVAADDHFEHWIVYIRAPSVLDNDTDLEGDALTVLLASFPLHGGLILNADGSFTYTPQARFTGTDSFTYRAFDGDALSHEATVTISVSQAPRTVERLITGPGASGGPHVRAFDPRDLSTVAEVLAYRPDFSGGVRVAAGDIDADGVPDIVTGTGPGLEAEVRVFRGTDNSLLMNIKPFAAAFTGGVFVASGDLDGDGRDDIVAAAGYDGGSHVRVFRGTDGTLLREFFAYAPAFTGGVSVATGDMNGDGRADIITGAGRDGGPHVRVFSGLDGSVLRDLFAYAAAFAGGVSVAAGDINADGRMDIITGAGWGGGPHVRVFSGADGSVLRDLQAYDAPFSGGVNVAAGDVDGDGQADIITAANTGGSPHLRIFSGLDGPVLHDVFAYDPAFKGGVFVACARSIVLMLENDWLAPDLD